MIKFISIEELNNRFYYFYRVSSMRVKKINTDVNKINTVINIIPIISIFLPIEVMLISKNSVIGLLFDILEALILILGLILIAAFSVLAERRIIGSAQKREGPNVVGFGYLQPLSDAFKLLFKEVIVPNGSKKTIFILAPCWVLFISLLAWKVIPFSLNDTSCIETSYGALYIYIFSSLNMLGLIFGGWASRSSYALLGAVRASAQIISYEVVIGVTIVQIAFITKSLDFKTIILYQFYSGWLVQILFCPILFFFVAILAETNRTPFDLPESESELVAGYNVEYSSILFAFFILSEYINILLICAVFVIFFWGGSLTPLLIFGKDCVLVEAVVGLLNNFVEESTRSNCLLVQLVIFITLIVFLLVVFKMLTNKKLFVIFNNNVKVIRLVYLIVFCIILSINYLFYLEFIDCTYDLIFLNLYFYELVDNLCYILVYESSFWFITKIVVCLNIFIAIRALLPRKRYDQLLELCWEVFLLTGLLYVFFIAWLAFNCALYFM